MTNQPKRIFISYRRTNTHIANFLYLTLKNKGFDVFLDTEVMGSGDFMQTLHKEVTTREYFLVVLTPSALEPRPQEVDVMRMEIELAIEHNRTIIPLMFSNFEFNEVKHYLTGTLARLPSFNGLRVPDEYLNEAISRLVKLFLAESPDSEAQIADEMYESNDHISVDKIDDKQQSEMEFEKGYQLGRLGTEYQAAIEHFQRAIELNPDFAEPYYRLGNVFANLGDEKSALKYWTIAMQKDPKNQLNSLIQSSIHLAKGEIKEANIAARRGVSQNPDLAEAYYRLALVLHRKGAYTVALGQYNKAISHDPSVPTYFHNRGVAHFELKMWTQAILDFDHALRLNPDFAICYFRRGMAWLQIGDVVHFKALTDFTLALELNPEINEAYYQRGLLQFTLGHLEQATQDFQSTIDLSPTDFNPYFEIIRIYVAKSDYQRAVLFYFEHRLYEQLETLIAEEEERFKNKLNVQQNSIGSVVGLSLEQNLKNKSALIAKKETLAQLFIDYGEWCKEQERYSDAFEQYQEAQRLATNNDIQAIIYEKRGDTHVATGEIHQAIENYGLAIDIDKGNVTLYFKRGLLYVKLDDLQNALADYGLCLSINPQLYDVLIRRGQLYMKVGQLQDALNDFNSAIDAKPKSEAYFRRAEVRLIVAQSDGELQNALKDIKKAIRQSFRKPQYCFLRGKILYCLGEYENALEDFYQEATEDDIDLTERSYWRALAHHKLGYLDKALDDISTAIAGDEKNVQYWFRRSHIYFDLEDYVNALTDINHVISTDPNFIEAYFERGYIMEMQRQYKLAIKNYEYVLNHTDEDNLDRDYLQRRIKICRAKLQH